MFMLLIATPVGLFFYKDRILEFGASVFHEVNGGALSTNWLSSSLMDELAVYCSDNPDGAFVPWKNHNNSKLRTITIPCAEIQ